MHELSLCQNIVKIINHQLIDMDCQKVTKVNLEVGQLAAVDKSALQFAFDAVTMDSKIQGAHLEIIEVEGQAICDNCHAQVAISQYYDACSACQQFSLQIIQGEELRVQSIEVE